MKITCVICQALLLSVQDVYATNCGHLYHQKCISQWIVKQPTCPQCRAKLNARPFRVYFNISNDLENIYEEGLLESKYEDLFKKYSDLKNEKKDMSVKLMTATGECKELGKKLKKSEEDKSNCKMTIAYFKDELKRSVEKNKQLDKMEQDLEKVTDELKFLRRIRLLVEGTESSVQESIDSMPCTPESFRDLLTYLEIIKKKSRKNIDRNGRLFDLNQSLHKELAKLKTDNKDLRERIDEYHNYFLNSELKESSPPESLPPAPSIDSLLPLAPPAKPSPPEPGSIDSFFPLNWAGPIKIIDKLPIAKLPSKGLKFYRPPPGDKSVSSTSASGPSRGYAYDGMGGSKRISLATPTPPEDLIRIRAEKKRKRVKPLNRNKKISATNCPDIEDFIELF